MAKWAVSPKDWSKDSRVTKFVNEMRKMSNDNENARYILQTLGEDQRSKQTSNHAMLSDLANIINYVVGVGVGLGLPITLWLDSKYEHEGVSNENRPRCRYQVQERFASLHNSARYAEKDHRYLCKDEDIIKLGDAVELMGRFVNMSGDKLPITQIELKIRENKLDIPEVFQALDSFLSSSTASERPSW